jgi:hypothetical protein
LIEAEVARLEQAEIAEEEEKEEGNVSSASPSTSVNVVTSSESEEAVQAQQTNLAERERQAEDAAVAASGRTPSLVGKLTGSKAEAQAPVPALANLDDPDVAAKLFAEFQAATTLHRFCSWCFTKQPQVLLSKNIVLRDVYRCTGPSCCSGGKVRRTLKCVRCNEGMTRGGDASDIGESKIVSYDDETCFNCDGHLSPTAPPDAAEGEVTAVASARLKWGTLTPEECVRQTSKHDMWCSWCFTPSTHLLQRKSILSGNRSVYLCLHCGERTLNCRACPRAMARGGAGWDDLRCAACSRESGMKGALAVKFEEGESSGDAESTEHERMWRAASKLRGSFFEKPRDIDRVIAELVRPSKQRDLATKGGLIRPFLLLVSMPGPIRNRVACQLGWTTVMQKTFGDAHAESWEILSSPHEGLQGRCSKSWEKVNPLAGRCNWHWILKRVWENAFAPTPLPKNIEAHAKKLGTKGQTLHGAEPGSDGSPSLEAAFEEQFLSQLSTLWRENLTDQQREDMDSLMIAAAAAGPKDPQADAVSSLRERMMVNAGIQRPDVLAYGISVVQSVLGISKLNAFLLACTITQTLIPALAPATGPVLASAALVATPLFIIGIAGLILSGLKLALNSSEGRCIGPVSVVLQQRLLLAAEGINLEDYLAPDED